MSKHIAPTNLDEYQAAYHAGVEYLGRGIDTGMKVPCPFCCAPDFMSWKVIGEGSAEDVMGKGAVCVECGRGVRALYQRSAAGLRFEMVQTVGDDPPSWLPAMRREAEAIAAPSWGSTKYILNGVETTTTQDVLTFDELIALAAVSEYASMTVKFPNGHGCSVTKGQAVQVVGGMIINAIVTGNG